MGKLTEDSAATVRFMLEWIAAPRPPVHPTRMHGRQSFPSFGEAVEFWRKQAPDAELVSLVEIEERRFDRTSELVPGAGRAALKEQTL